MSKQKALRCLLMRGGTSKGPFFYADDLPQDITLRDKVLLAAMGSPDKRQIDGLGGAHPLTSKVGIVSKSSLPEIELDFLFAQLQPDKDSVDTHPNCGNMLAAVVPFAIEIGLITPQPHETTVNVRTLNTGMVSAITVQTPDGELTYQGDAKIDGVPGTSAPIQIEFLDTEGSLCGSLLPTGNLVDLIDLNEEGCYSVTCIDNGMPMVLINANDMACSGYESVDSLNNQTSLKTKLEKLRLAAALKMGLGDVQDKNYPKMCLLAPPIAGGAIHCRCFIPHVCHEAIGVLAAVTIATACVLPDSVAYGLSTQSTRDCPMLSIEHPSGEFTVTLTLDPLSPSPKVKKAALLRTARLIMRGEVMIPNHLL